MEAGDGSELVAIDEQRSARVSPRPGSGGAGGEKRIPGVFQLSGGVQAPGRGPTARASPWLKSSGDSWG
jgi:hypothetical protein